MKFSKSNQPRKNRKFKKRSPYELMRYAAETGNVGLYNEMCYQTGNTNLFVPVKTSRNTIDATEE